MSDIPSKLTAKEACRAIKHFLQLRDAKIIEEGQWLNTNLSDDSGASPSLDKECEQKISRRNQVLYCLGQTNQEEFNYATIEAAVRQRFPESNRRAVLNVTTALSELADKDTGMLQRNAKGDGYMLKNPMFRTCLRAILRCAEDSETIQIAEVNGL